MSNTDEKQDCCYWCRFYWVYYIDTTWQKCHDEKFRWFHVRCYDTYLKKLNSGYYSSIPEAPPAPLPNDMKSFK